MSIFVFTNLIAGVSGLDKSSLNTASLFAQAGYDTHIVNCVGAEGGFKFIEPKMPVDPRVYIHSLQAWAPDGGKHLHEKFKIAYTLVQPLLRASFTNHDLRALRSFNEMIGEEDIIIFTHPLQAVLFHLALGDQEISCTTILQIHGNFTEGAEDHNRELLLEGLSRVNKLQIVSESMRSDIKSITGFKDEDILFIPNVHFPVKIERKKHETFNVAIIGSLQDRKNQIDAVKAIQLLDDNSIHLNIWGGANNAYGKFLKLYVQNSGIENRVNFCGLGDERQLYEATDLVILTSRNEGFGYTLVEAATHSIPCVAYDYDYGADEVIEDEQNGYIVPMYDIDQLAERIAQLRNDDALRNKLGHAARQTFDEKFSPQSILVRYQQQFPDTVATRGDAVAQHFLRDGKIIAQQGTVEQKNYRIFRKLVASLYRFTEVSDAGSYNIARFCTAHNGLNVAHSSLKGRAKVFLKRVTNRGKLMSRNFLLAGRIGDGFSYILNTTVKGDVEEVREYSRYAPELHDQTCLTKADVFSNTSGPYIPYPSYEPIRSLTDENGRPIRYVTKQLTRNGTTAPHFHFHGTFAEMHLVFNSGKKTTYTNPGWTYKSIFEKLIELEQEHDFLNYTVADVHVWELIRAPVIEQLMMAFGMWDEHFSGSHKPDTRYHGTKRLREAPSSERLLFEFTRKSGDIDPRTRHLRQGDCVIVEYPQTFGYTVGSYTDGPVYPIDDFNKAAQKMRGLRHAHKYKGDFFEDIFRDTFKLDIDFKGMINARILKFRRELNFWDAYFAKRQVKEAVIPSAYWSAGICSAAKKNNVKITDVQYALEGKLHPTNTFSAKAAYTADTFYAWSDYWKEDVPKYGEVLVRKRKFADAKPMDEAFDFCILSQPRVKNPIKRFAVELANRYPDKKIAYCLHPDEDLSQEIRDKDFATYKNIRVLHGSSTNATLSSNIVVGGYSTTLYEAAYFGKSVYVLPVPGWENVERAVEEGIFRLVEHVEDLTVFPPSPLAKSLF
ncbi:glycosyltransferase family 4 protein [Aliiroseovarius crassostreae]|uniref:glycosyltransferase family 4 protein n=1 Tax=Aliiroseovarius crassostreae TaxID=154981 RepID=UPI003C7B30E7